MKTVQTWSGTIIISDKIEKQLTDSILNHLNSDYTLESGEVVKGQAVSYLTERLRDDSFKNIGKHIDDIAAALGFKVVKARNNRNQKATIVTI